MGGGVLLFSLGSNLGGVGPERGLRRGGRRGWCEAADEASDEVAGATLGDGEEEVMEEALCHLAKAAGAAREL